MWYDALRYFTSTMYFVRISPEEFVASSCRITDACRDIAVLSATRINKILCRCRVNVPAVLSQNLGDGVRVDRLACSKISPGVWLNYIFSLGQGVKVNIGFWFPSMSRRSLIQITQDDGCAAMRVMIRVFSIALVYLACCYASDPSKESAEVQDRVYFMKKCSGSGCPYTASWLAHTNLYKKIPWWLDSTKMEAASFNM